MPKLTAPMPKLTVNMPKRCKSINEATALCMAAKYHAGENRLGVWPAQASPLHGFVSLQMPNKKSSDPVLSITFGNRLPTGDKTAAFIQQFFPQALRFWLQWHYAKAYLRAKPPSNKTLGWSTGELIEGQRVVAAMPASIVSEQAAEIAGRKAAGLKPTKAKAAHNDEEE